MGVEGLVDAPMLAFGWFKDEDNYQHTGVYCSNCGTIHDCTISFLKIPLSIIGLTNPYKVLDVITIVPFAQSIFEDTQEYGLNCREVALYIYHINQMILDKMIREKLGDCFKEPAMTYKEFVLHMQNR